MFHFSVALWTANRRWKPYIRGPSFRKQHYKSFIMDKTCFCLITPIICPFFKAWIAIDQYFELQLGSSLALPHNKPELWEAWLRNMFLCKPFLWGCFCSFFFSNGLTFLQLRWREFLSWKTLSEDQVILPILPLWVARILSISFVAKIIEFQQTSRFW